jgi:hypothetical protein
MNYLNDVPSSMAFERIEGQQLTNDLDILSLQMEDEEIARAIGDRVTTSESFWNSHLKLDSVRQTVDTYYLNTYYSQDDLYDFQVEYKDNRLFVAIETLVAMAIAKPPMPVVMQAYDTDASYELAQQLQKALLCKYEDLYLKGKFQMIARHLLMGYRLAVMKYRWDDTIGSLQEDGSRFGDVAVDVVRPQRIVIDAGAQYIDDIPLIAEFRSSPLEELCEKYPNKRDEILVESGKKAGALTARVGYLEVHNTFYKSGGRTEGIVWKFGKVIMDSTKSPFWNYDETYQDERGVTRQANFLPKPTKPYALFNFTNLGKWVIDDTSLMDQAIPLQRINNKIGRQIVENAEQANSGTIWNSKMVKQDDVAKLLGDPGERVMATGDVREAAARLPYNELAQYVRDERLDARSEIDNIFSTHGAIRGEVTGNKTLGQDVMSQRGDSARISVLATSIEDGGDRLYKGITQCFKVFYDTPQLFRYTSEDSLTSFFTYGRDQIEDNVGLKVKSGSVLPEDPIATKQETLQLAPMLDPLNLAKGLNKPNPKEWAKQNLMFRLFPDQYMQEFLGVTPGQNQQDPSALQHIQMLNAGQNVPPEMNPTKEHLATHQQFMESPQFKQLPPEVQALHVQHVQAEVQAAKGAMGLSDKPGMPAGQQQQTQTPGVPGGGASPNPETNVTVTGTPPQPPQGAIINSTAQ